MEENVSGCFFSEHSVEQKAHRQLVLLQIVQKSI